MKRLFLSCLLCGVILLTGCAQKDAGSTVSYENVDSINAEASAKVRNTIFKNLERRSLYKKKPVPS